MTGIYEKINEQSLRTGSYAPLAGIAKPILEPIKNIDITQVSQVQTLVFSGALITDNVVNGKIGGVAIDPVTFITDNATTLTALAVEIASQDDVLTAVSDGTDTITITTVLGKEYLAVTDFIVTLGAGQVTATVTETVVAIIMTVLEAGLFVIVDSVGVATLATDNATHFIVGSFLDLTNGTRELLDTLSEIQGLPLELGFVQGQVKEGQVLVVGNTATIVAGVIIKAVGGESQTFTVDAVETLDDASIVAQLKFKV